MNKLSVKNVEKKYGNFVALAPTSLDVSEGQFLTLLGPSGSGKTTLLMIISGLLEPDGGQIWIDGRETTHTPPFMRDIGMVFQNYALFPHLTIYENIAFPLKMRNVPTKEIDKEVFRVLEIVQLAHVANRLPSALSGGQQQRIALARCIVYKPSIILMDEPLGALDKKLRDQLQIEIKHLHKQLGITVIYVTHDQQEALTMSDRICLMNKGRIEQMDTPKNIYLNPVSVFSADFLGDSNIFPADVSKDGAGRSIIKSDAFGGQAVYAPSDTLPGPAYISIRPENISLGSGEDKEAMNSIQGTLKEIIFTGGITRFYVELARGQVIFGTVLTALGSTLPNEGDVVHIYWPIESTVMLPVPE